MKKNWVWGLFSLVFLMPMVAGLSLLLPETDLTRPIIQLQTILLCDQNQTLHTETVSYVPGETQLEVRCIDSAGNVSDASFRFFLYILGSFCLPFVPMILIIIIWGDIEVTRNEENALPEGYYEHAGQTNLSDQLQQLEDAYGKRLISRVEYERSRQKLLDRLGE